MLRVANLSRKVACRLSQYTDQSYRAIVESVLDVIVRLSPELRYQYVTPNALDILGYHPDELVGKPFREFVHPEDLIEIGRSGVLDEFFSRSLTFRFMRKDGGTVWIETRCRDIYVGDQVAETISVFRDITERKVSEWELNQSVKRYQAVVDSSIDAIVVADRNFQVVSVNPAATAMFGYPRRNWLASPWICWFPKDRERGRGARSAGLLRIPPVCKGGGWNLPGGAEMARSFPRRWPPTLGKLTETCGLVRFFGTLPSKSGCTSKP